jgi:hypothetical protein
MLLTSGEQLEGQVSTSTFAMTQTTHDDTQRHTTAHNDTQRHTRRRHNTHTDNTHRDNTHTETTHTETTHTQTSHMHQNATCTLQHAEGLRLFLYTSARCSLPHPPFPCTYGHTTHLKSITSVAIWASSHDAGGEIAPGNRFDGGK